MHRLFTVLILSVCSAAYGQEIALTFDDAPMPDSNLFTGQQRTQMLIQNLQSVQVDSAMMFVTTNNINKHSAQRLLDYERAGFVLANHSHSHFSPDKNDIAAYLGDISQAHKVVSEYKTFTPFYRYPYLHQGESRADRDRIRAHLKSLNYDIGYITVDNYEWYMNQLLQNAIEQGKVIDYDKLETVYIEVLWNCIQFYDAIAKEVLGRSPKHVLLLHENDISALYVGQLVKFLKAQGWAIISPAQAYTDPIASNIPDVLFNGQGRIGAIAASEGWDHKKLKHPSENIEYLDALFSKRQVFSDPLDKSKSK